MIQQLRTALYALLSGAGLKDAQNTACGVYDHVPQPRPAMPYLAMEDTTSEPWNTDTSDGAETVTELRVFSDKRGAKNAAHIADQVYTLLQHQDLADIGATLVIMEVVSVQIERGDDGATREAVIRVRILVDDITPTSP